MGSVLLGVIVHLGNSRTNPNRRGRRWERVGWGEAGCTATRMRHEAETAALRLWAPPSAVRPLPVSAGQSAALRAVLTGDRQPRPTCTRTRGGEA